MKTIWKTKTDQIWANKKRQEFEEKTGVKWDAYHSGRGYQFAPVITRRIELCDLEYAEKELLPHLGSCFKAKDFLTLSELTGLDLVTVMSMAKTLVMNQKAVPTVTRMGGFGGVYRRDL